jgi:hypothetical protein
MVWTVFGVIRGANGECGEWGCEPGHCRERIAKWLALSQRLGCPVRDQHEPGGRTIFLQRSETGAATGPASVLHFYIAQGEASLEEMAQESDSFRFLNHCIQRNRGRLQIRRFSGGSLDLGGGDLEL